MAVLALPFLTGFGQKPLVLSSIFLVACFMQLDCRRSVIYLKKPIELKLYTTWGLWAIGTGFFMDFSAYDFYGCVKVLLRQFFLLWSLYAIFIRQRQCSYIYWVFLGVAMLQVVAVLLGFHLDRNVGEVGGEIVKDVIDLHTTRAEGLTGNANVMGFAMLFGIWSCIMLWKGLSSRVITMAYRGVLLAAMVLMSYYAIQSGSRKTILVLVVLFFAWIVWMVPGRFSIKSVLIAFFGGVAFLIVAAAVSKYIMSETYLGARFMQLFDAGGGSATEGFKENVRYSMYIDGFKFWLHNPIAGIGLGQFGVRHWSGMYSHSDYMEPLACTGLVGFLLYHGYSLTVTMRLVRLLKRKIPPDIVYTIKGMLMFMICNHYLIGLGAPHWMGIEHNLIVVFIGTYAIRIWAEFVVYRPIYAT